MANNPNVINGTDYVAIATYYSDARAATTSSVGYLYDAVYTIVISNEIYPTLDLITEFWGSYRANTNIMNSATNFVSAVITINQHVLNRSATSITTINDYLVDENVKVPMGWAELCKITGILICKDRISNPPSPTYLAADGLTVSRFADGTAIPTTC